MSVPLQSTNKPIWRTSLTTLPRLLKFNCYHSVVSPSLTPRNVHPLSLYVRPYSFLRSSPNSLYVHPLIHPSPTPLYVYSLFRYAFTPYPSTRPSLMLSPPTLQYVHRYASIRPSLTLPNSHPYPSIFPPLPIYMRPYPILYTSTPDTSTPPSVHTPLCPPSSKSSLAFYKFITYPSIRPPIILCQTPTPLYVHHYSFIRPPSTPVCFHPYSFIVP